MNLFSIFGFRLFGAPALALARSRRAHRGSTKYSLGGKILRAQSRPEFHPKPRPEPSRTTPTHRTPHTEHRTPQPQTQTPPTNTRTEHRTPHTCSSSCTLHGRERERRGRYALLATYYISKLDLKTKESKGVLKVAQAHPLCLCSCSWSQKNI